MDRICLIYTNVEIENEELPRTQHRTIDFTISYFLYPELYFKSRFIAPWVCE